MVRGSPEHRQYTSKIDKLLSRRSHEQFVVKPRCTSLPEGFTPFHLSGEWREASYLTYLHGRGLTDRTIGLYRMGYADHGPLAGRVIVPSFDAVGTVNFWSARSIDPNERLRYRLPVASKDIVSNEHMVDWTMPIYLVEGIFDEIAIGPQAISLYGKFVLPGLATRLVERRPPMVYVCLDSDAREDALDLMRRLIGYGLTCSLPDVKGKDPGSVPFSEIARACIESRSTMGNAGLLRCVL